MKYHGGKNRLAKRLAAVIAEHRPPGAPYVEPFMGSCAVAAQVPGERHLSDTCEPLVTMWRAALDGWRPPEQLSESEWRFLRALEDPRDPLTAFAGFPCSWGGRWFQGYARSSTEYLARTEHGRNYATAAARSITRRAAQLRGATIRHADYRQLAPVGAVVYCDPPYAGTTGYEATGAFDPLEFWNVVERWARANAVLVSEYGEPPPWIDAELAWELPRKCQLEPSRVNTERVWRLKS